MATRTPVPLWKQGNVGTLGISQLEQEGYVLSLEHVPTGRYVEFPAFLENFSDAYTSEWSAEQVFGRMDPIATFAGTRRAISVSWIIPAESMERGSQNLQKVNTLMQMLYPLYTKRSGATTMNMGPLMKVGYLNLIQNSELGGPLLGYVNGFTMDPLTEEGTFYGTTEAGIAVVIPKTIRLNFELTVLHEHPLGFIKGKEQAITEYRDGQGKFKKTKFSFRSDKNNAGSDFPYRTTPPTDSTVTVENFTPSDSVISPPATRPSNDANSAQTNAATREALSEQRTK